MLAVLHSAQAVPTAPQHAAASLYQLPLAFEANQGQSNDRVRFLARGPGYNIFLTASEAVFALPRAPAMRMQLIGSAADPRVQGVDALPGKVNYFRGKDAANWQTGVPIYQRVRYSAVYPGIDLVYYGKSQQLEYDFIVAPGADPGAIKLAFAGVERTTVDARGDLILKTAGAPPLRFQTPVIYQTDGGGRHAVDGGYVRRGPHQIGFRVGAYDRTRPLIIDPVLSYSTYLGGSRTDGGDGIAVDATGAVYVAGTTSSTDFPGVNAVPPQNDLFIAKLTPDGTALVYATILGGNATVGARGGDGAHIAVDAAGAAYVFAETSSSDFPTVNAFQPAYGGLQDAVVVKLSADGSRLIYSTYLGGSWTEYSHGIAVDATGAAYLGGATLSQDFPADTALNPTSASDFLRAFVTKLAPDGSALVYSAYLGTVVSDLTNIAVDSLGAAYVVGVTDFDGEDGALVNPFLGIRGAQDAFIFKVAPDGKSLVYSTGFGGSYSDRPFGVAVDASGAAYVTGGTESGDFPTTSNAVQPQHDRDGWLHVFVVKFAPEGGAMIYGTYLAGSRPDIGAAIAVDTAGAAYVTGKTDSSDFPTVNAIQPALHGATDAFISKLSPDGASLVHSTFLGGGAQDDGRAIAVDLMGAAYVTGYTASTDFPTVNALQQVIGNLDCADASDAFVAKITADSLASPAASGSGASSPTSGSSNASTERSGGGGAMDVLILAVLASLAVAGGIRRRRPPARHLG
jgi:hypothetical protein